MPDPVEHVVNGMQGGGTIAGAEVAPNDLAADEIDFSRAAASAAATEPGPTGTEVSLANEWISDDRPIKPAR